MKYAEELKTLVLGAPWLMDALGLVRELGPPKAYIAAGSIRNLVWNCRTGRPSGRPAEDLDIVYFDPAEPRDSWTKYQALLKQRDPSLDWEVVNQAFVHTWLSEQLGRPQPPFQSLKAALRTWPETATSVAVRLDGDEGLDILAPFGLDDLFNLVLRPNPGCPSPDAYASRVGSKAWAVRWPELQVLPPIVSR